MSEPFDASLHGLITILLLSGGTIAAVVIFVHERKNPPNCARLTDRLARRSWSTVEVFILFSVLFILYGLAGCSGQLFHAHQIPLILLIVTVLIHSILVALIVFMNRKREDRRCALGLDPGGIGSLAAVPVIYMAFLPFFMLASKGVQLLLQEFFGAEAEMQPAARIVSEGALWLRALYILTAVTVAPIYEELMFRGIFFPYLVKRFGLKTAAFVVSVLFALMHFHLPSFLPLVLLSVLFCLTYWRISLLWPCIGLHMLHNAVSILALNLAQ